MEPFLGQIQPFGFNFAPRGWLFCDGQLLPISSNTALFSLLGTTFGGDGRTTFALPDLRGRSIVHIGNGPGLSRIVWGQKGGMEDVTLFINNLPNHSHNQLIPVNSEDGGNTDDPTNAVLGNAGTNNYNTSPTPNTHLQMSQTATTGGGQSFYKRDPFTGICVSIAIIGIFPSRS